MSRTRKPGIGMLAIVAMLSSAAAQAANKDIVQTAVEAGSFKTLATALQSAGLVETLKSKGPFTVFAPTDEAFSKLPKGTVESLLKPENKSKLVGVLTYHVVKGNVPASKVVELQGATTVNGQLVDIQVKDGKVQVDTVNVVKTDIECSNGVIHVIDAVLLPASDNLAETAEKAGKFATLLAAAKAAGLDEALANEKALTVFAPTDEAFAKLPEGTVETLLKPENKAQLAAILKYHVVPGRVYSSDALKAGEAKTLQGAEVKIAVRNGKAKVNNADLIATDVDASNGVIHIINAVLLPPEEDASNASNDPRHQIEEAIRVGAPLFNAGHTDQCAKIYMTTVERLLSSDNHGMCSSTTKALETALHHAQESHCSNSRAWTMRRAMDQAYTAMSQR